MSYWIAIAVGTAFAYSLGRVTRRLRSQDESEWLARVVIMEHSSVGPGDEWTAIMQVAQNRVDHPSYPNTIREVVATSSWPGGGARAEAFVEAIQACGGIGYRSAFGHRAPPDNSHWGEALAHARSFVDGQFANRIGERTHFCHPGQSCGSNDSTNPEIKEGRLNSTGRLKCVRGRLIPLWALPSSDPDSRAEFEPVVVGTAIFA